MRIFEFNATVAAVSAYDDFDGQVVSSGTFLGEFNGDVLSSDVLDSIVQPRGVTQVVSMELWLNGSMVSQQNLRDSLSVSRDFNNIVQSWGFTTPLNTAEGPFGTPFACIGPSIGKDNVTIYGVYWTVSGPIRIALLTNGVVDNAHREAGEGGIFEVFNGVDSGGRYDGVKITKQFPPGHGLPRGRVGREIMASIGETQVDFEDGNRMDKELQLVDTEPLSTLAEIFEVENRKLYWSSDAYAVNPQVGRVRPDEHIAFSFEERDLLRISTVSLDSVANVITLVVANGTKQGTTGPCGVVWQTTTEFTYESPYTMRTSLYKQNADGTYDTVPTPDPLTDPVLVKKIETKKAFKCDTLIEEIVKTWEMVRTEVPRHLYEGVYFPWTPAAQNPELDNGWRCISCYTDDNNGVGGGPAYRESVESLRLFSISHTYYTYIYYGYGNVSGGFTSSAGVFEWVDALSLPPFSDYRQYNPNSNEAQVGQYGQAIGSVTFFARWGHIEGAIKARLGYPYPLSLWDEIEPDVDQEIWGNGSGVNNINSNVSTASFILPEGAQWTRDYDVLMPWNITCNVFYGDSNNFLIQDDLYQWGWRAPRGNAFYYNENDSRSEQSQTLQLTDSIVNTYSETGESHSQITTSTDNITGHITTVVTNGLPGHLPAIERLDVVDANPVIYQDGEQVELNQDAKRSDTEQITVTVPFDFFLTCHVPREVVVEFPWAENLEELQQQSEALAQESSAMVVSFTLPANFLIREAQAIHLTYRPLGIDHNLRVSTVGWSQDTASPITTPVSCKLYRF